MLPSWQILIVLQSTTANSARLHAIDPGRETNTFLGIANERQPLQLLLCKCNANAKIYMPHDASTTRLCVSSMTQITQVSK
jgi:hypothetical protein